MTLNRRQEREIVFQMLFAAASFEESETEELFLTLAEEQEEEHPGTLQSRYIKTVFCGAREYFSRADEIIAQHAKGWKTNRLSRVSRAVLRLGAYELAFVEGVPAPVAINEAVELSKKFDDPKARAFINGVLNAVKNELAEGGVKNEENE